MRLVKIDSRGELSLTDNINTDNINTDNTNTGTPRYAILSHTWGANHDEVTFNDLKEGSGISKMGYTKIQFCKEQAQKDGLQYFWIDTCCIDQTNQAELNQAIVSMFKWYANADKCYAYLSDVSSRKRDNTGNTQVWETAFRKSKWFTRGWTLQELLAPRHVEFYSREGDRLGDKSTLGHYIYEVTKLPRTALQGAPLSDFSGYERLKWVSKRKTQRPEDIAYCLLGIVNVSSMLPIYGEGEASARSRLRDEMVRSYGWHLQGTGREASDSCESKNHSSRATCSNTADMSLFDHRRTLMTSLSFEQMDARRSTIKTAHSTTCQWLMSHPVYLDWVDPSQLHQHCGFLWISGKPGAGKSTLVKFAHARANTDKHKHDILLSFFFNARGDELERSTVGMYRALVFQLLKQLPELQELLDDLNDSSEDQSGSPTWTIENLCRILSAASTKLENHQLKCFIDALDECDEEQVREMIGFWEGLGQTALENGARLYTCFASRHYPTIDIRSGRRLTLENEEGHAQDLVKYVQSHLRAKGKYIEEVRMQITEKANGVFMWAVLVVSILNEEFKRGRIFAVKKRLQEIPAQLSALFSDILRRDGANMNDLLLCLRWILFAKRPLKREEFYFAMVAGLDPDSDVMTAWDAERITVDDMNRFVLSSSKGLAELTKSKTPTVQFIHESVRDFLIKDKGLCEIWPNLRNNLSSTSHDRLKECCRKYLNVDISALVTSDQNILKASSEPAKILRHTLTTHFPFLEYASRFVLSHADEAAEEVSQDVFLGDFALSAWIKIHNLLALYGTRRYTSAATLLYTFADQNLATLARTTCENASRMGVRGERYHYPLFAALANGHRHVVRALLQQNWKTEAEDIAADLEFGPAHSARKDHTPLFWAIDKGHQTVAEVLINFKDIDLSQKNLEGRTVLSLAAIKGYDRLVKSLLTIDGININSTDKSYRTPLSYAVEQGHERVVQIFLDGNAELELKDYQGMTALHWAASGESNTILQLLLDKDADIEAKDKIGKTALIYAVKGGSKAIVQLLLDKDVNIEATDQKGKTALLWAAEHDREAIVHLLLNKNAYIETIDNSGRTALIWATICNQELIVQLLLDKDVNIEAMDQNRKTALHWAAEHDREAIVQLLLDKNVNIEATDDIGKTALIWAFKRGSKAIVQLLLDKNANIEAMSIDGTTALMWAIIRDREAIVQLLLDRDVNIEARDNSGRTALLCAANLNREAIVQLLLDRDVNIEATDNSGKTALHWAAYHDREAIVQLLLDKNVNIEVKDNRGKTALSWAVTAGQKAIVQLLLDRDANIEATDYDNETALSWAFEEDREAIVQLLLDKDANIDATDKTTRGLCGGRRQDDNMQSWT